MPAVPEFRQTGRRSGSVTTEQELLVYTTQTCGDCASLKAWLDRERIGYREIRIEDDPDARRLVREAARGYMSVPTVILPDGRVLVEPTPAQMRAALAG